MDRIVNAWLEITDACNLNCPYCYMGAGHVFHGYSMEDYTELLNFLRVLGTKCVVLSGGEPCLHPNIRGFIELACMKGFRVGLATNGTIVASDLIDCLIKNDVFVQISIDSIRRLEYSQSRGKNLLDKVVANISSLQSCGVSITLSCTMTDVNSASVLEICKFSKEMHIHTVHFGVLIPTERSQSTETEFSNLYDTLVMLYRYQIENFLDIQIDIIEESILPFVYFESAAVPEKQDSLYYCNAMAGKNIQIDTKGNMRQCGLIEQSVPLNIFHLLHHSHSTLQQIAELYCSTLKPVSVAHIPACANCTYKNFCRGGCRACAYCVYGEATSPLPYCTEMQKYFRFLDFEYKEGKMDDYITFLKLLGSVNDDFLDNSTKRNGLVF